MGRQTDLQHRCPSSWGHEVSVATGQTQKAMALFDHLPFIFSNLGFSVLLMAFHVKIVPK